jgi:DNA topoisomerase-2
MSAEIAPENAKVKKTAIIRKKIVVAAAAAAPVDKQVPTVEDKSAEVDQLDDIAKKYQKKSQIEHIKDLPDTYIGSIITETINQWIINTNADTNADTKEKDEATLDNILTDVDMKAEPSKPSKLSIIAKEVEYVPGLRSIIEEILVNAFDNMNRINQKIATEHKRLKKVSYIKVATDMATGQISIENDGEGIDVAEHPEYKVYIPQMIFGELLTSGNYNKDEQKITGGKNGYGAKLTNIFSTYFKVETVDRIRKLKYSQEYHDNMTVKDEPVITEYKEVPFTRITFIPDYKRFNMPGLSAVLENIIHKRAIDMFACSRGQIQVYYNNEPIALKTFTDYMELYLEPGTLSVACKPNDRWEIGACMSPNFTFQQVSFVNGINTQRGGKHIEYIVKQITKKMVDLIQKKKKSEVKESFIKDNLMIFVNATIVNPTFDSQTKETLTTLPKNFGSECVVPDAFIEKLAESGIMDRAMALNEFRDSQALKKTDGVKKKRVLDIPKLDDAHWAGSKKADQCTLILTEGDSAKAMAVAGISVIPNGHDLYGIFPLRGKLLNTRDKDDIDIAQNKEICNIKKILALQEDMEYKDTSTLRYGRIMLMTDSDVDGSHIKGLIMNFLSKWPSLMKLTGFITSLLTPIVKVWKKSDKKGKLNATPFYTLTAFNDWLTANNNGRGYEFKYYKGLGSSTPQEGKEYFRAFKIVNYHWDDAAADSIDKAFNKERADDRKLWLADYDSSQILDINQSRITITDFINKDLIHFSNYDNHRSIPSVFDGLKPSTRKIMYCSFKRKLNSEIKVAQLAGYVSEHGAYHHGEASLNGAIVNLAQNYIGTNNINLLMPEGQFGTRITGGHDYAAPRYIFTYLSKITHLLFNKDDNTLLTPVIDDGESVEPRFYMPIMPMVLINGTSGIGTGWSSDIPQFNPLDILENIRRLMRGEPINPMVPWYRGFTGSVKRIGANRWMTKGRFKVIDSATIEITELPIGLWTQDFKELLDQYEMGYKVPAAGSGKKSTSTNPSASGDKVRKPRWVEFADADGKLIKSYKNDSSDSAIKFTIKFEPQILSNLLCSAEKAGSSANSNMNELEKIFKLSTTLSCANTMNLYDENNKLKKFESPEAILEYYFAHRLTYYAARLKYLISVLEQDLLMLSTRARFILDVIADVVKVRNVPKVEVVKQLIILKYPINVDGKIIPDNDLSYQTVCKDGSGDYDYLISMPIYSLTKEKVDQLMKEKDEQNQKLEILKKKTDKDIWEDDLKQFETDYKKHMDDFYEYMDIDSKKISHAPVKPSTRRIIITKKSTAATAASTAATTPIASSVGSDIDDS